MKERSILGELLSWLIYIVIVVILSLGIITFIGQRTKVSGHSMETTLSDGDNLIVDKISYRFRDPERFEIIVFPFQYEEHTYYIKRIIGLPGETIQIKEGQILIDGETYVEKKDFPSVTNPGLAEEPITLGGTEYFVLGDNRNNSEDSRHVDIGNVDKKNIVGKLWMVTAPFDKFGFLKK